MEKPSIKWDDIQSKAFELRSSLSSQKQETDKFFESLIKTFQKQWQQKDALNKQISRTVGYNLFLPFREAALAFVKSSNINEKIHGYLLLLVIEENLFLDGVIRLNAKKGQTKLSIYGLERNEIIFEIDNETNEAVFSHLRFVAMGLLEQVFNTVPAPLIVKGTIGYPAPNDEPPTRPLESYENEEAQNIVVGILKYHFDNKKEVVLN